MKINVVDKLGKLVRQVEIKPFSQAKTDLKAVLLSYLHNQKQRTKAAKNRGQVAGSGIKPWRQKGTGRARAGSRQSGLWKGGGVIFAPAYYKTVKKINKKVKLAALKQLLQQKIKDGEVQIVQKISLDKPRTKTLAQLLANLKLTPKKTLIISQKPLKNLQLSARNLAQTSYFSASQINALKLAQHQYILITQKALDWLINKK